MKSFIVFASIFIAATSAIDQAVHEKMMAAMQNAFEKCSDELSPSADDLAELIAFKFPPTSHVAKCVVFCVYKNFNAMGEDGSYNKPAAHEHMEQFRSVEPVMVDKMGQVIEKCMSGDAKGDPCETAANLAACAKKESDLNGLSEMMV